MPEPDDGVLVEILMPTYQADTALMRAAIKSVLAQTRADWLLTIARDGGDEDIASLINEFKDARIRLFEFPHRGKPQTLNELHKTLRGRYVAFLDDDDIWYPTHLETCLSEMDKGRRLVYTNFHEVGKVRTKSGGWTEISRSPMNRGALTNVFLFKISHSNMMVERNLLEISGGYDESRSYFIDWDMLLKLAEHERPVYIDRITGEYNLYFDDRGRLANRISACRQDTEEKESMFRRMVVRSRARITDEDVLAIASDLMLCKAPRPWKTAFSAAYEELVMLRLGLYFPSLYRVVRKLGKAASLIAAAPGFLRRR